MANPKRKWSHARTGLRRHNWTGRLPTVSHAENASQGM